MITWEEKNLKRIVIVLIALLLTIALVSCANKGKTADTTKADVTTETTAGTSETSVTETIEFPEETTAATTETSESETTAEETTTSPQESTTESEKINVAEIEANVQNLWAIESADKNIRYSSMNFRFNNGIITGGSKNQFGHEYSKCGTYKITDDGKLLCTFYSIATGTVSSCVYVPGFDDTGESMTLYCESSDGLSYFAGREDDFDYTLTLKLTNYPSESKSHDARLKGDWATMKNQEITYLSLGYFNGFRFEARIKDEMKRGTWTGYSGQLTLTFEDGSVATYTYELDSMVSVIRLLYGKEECCELDRMVPDY